MFGLSLLLIFAWKWPLRALYACFGAVLLGGMKFRMRSAGAVLEGSVDTQILFELAVYGAIGLAACTAAVALRLHRRRLRPVEWVLVAYATWALASVGWSRSPTLSGVRALQLVVLTVFLLALTRADLPGRILRTTSRTYSAFVVGAAAMALLFPWAAGGTVDYFSGAGRFGWFSDHPITVAMHAGTAALLILSVSSYSRQEPRLSILGNLVGWMALALCCGVLLMTGSRGPAAALLSAGVVLVAARLLTPSYALAMALLTGAAVTAALMFPGPPQGVLQSLGLESTAIARFALRGGSLDHLASFSGRLDLWKGAAAVALQSPVIGQGFIASRGALLEVAHWGGHAHNGPMQSVLDLGIVGAGLLWTAVFVQLARFLLASPVDTESRRVRLAVIGILSFLLLASVTDPGIAGPPGALPMMGLMALLVPLDAGART